MQIRNWFILALFCACLIGCGGSEIVPGRSETPAAPQAQLPALAELDSMRQPSAVLASGFNLLSSEHTDLLNDTVTLTPPPGNIGWAIFDLGSIARGSVISTVSFPAAPDWSGLDPTGEAWLALADYGLGRWRFVHIGPADGQSADLTALGATDFSSPGGHAYAAVVTLHPALPLGSELSVEHGGLLAQTVIFCDELPDGLSGRHISTAISSEGAVDIVLMNEAEDGGVVLRGDLEGAGAINWVETDLSEVGFALNSASHYKCQYRSDNRLTIMAARTQNPASLRFIRETNEGTLVFTNETAVNTEQLPADFSNPQYDYDLALADEGGDDDPHVVYIGPQEQIVYVFRFVGGWFQTSGGEDNALFPSITCRYAETGEEVFVAYQDTSRVNLRLVVQTHGLRDLNDSWSAVETISPSAWRKAGQFAEIMDSLDGSLSICHSAEPASQQDLDLNFAHDSDGNIGSGWLNQTADKGFADFDDAQSASRDVGFACRIAQLDSGQPVIAYYDEDGALWLAAAVSAAGGSGEDSGWLRLLLDDESGFDPGEYLSLAVHPASGAGSPQHIVVGYEKRNSLDDSQPWYSVVSWLSE